MLDSVVLITKAATYLADASVEAVMMTACSTALVNSVLGVVWKKAWGGYLASKSRLCSIPFVGIHLFGPELEKILERSSDKAKGFPFKKQFYNNKRLITRLGQETRTKGKNGLSR